MSAQLGVGLNRQGLTHKKSAGQRTSGRQSSVNVRAQDDAKAVGTSILRGLPSLPFGTGTLSLKPQKSGTSFLQSLTGSVNKTRQAPDAGTVYVAGATGRTGARIVRELLQAGLKVRAGVRDIDSAQQSLDVAQTYGLLSAQEVKQVSLVTVDYSKPEVVKAAIGNARKVVCALGAAENDALNFANVKKVDFDFTTELINSAAAVGVEQFVMVSSLGTGKVGFPAAVLNLFGGVLVWKRESEKALEASGMTYTIVRPGGMERPTDAYKKTHNMVLAPRDTTFGGQVSRLQVAELIGTIMLNPELAENKVLEVTAETTAPRMTYQELLSGIEPDMTREDQMAFRAASIEARSELEEAQEKAEAARSALAAADARFKELADRLKAAKAQEAEVKAKVAPVLKEGASAEKALEAAQAAASKAALEESAARAVLDAAKKAASQGQLMDKKQLKAVAEQVLNPPKEQPAVAQAAKPVLSLFGAASPAPEEPPAKAPEAEEPKRVARSPSPFSFGSLFGAQEPVQLDESTAAIKVPAKEPTPAPAARARTPPPPAPKPAVAAAPAKPAPAPTPAPAAKPVEKAKSASPQPLFAGFFNFGQQTIDTDQVSKVEVPPKVQEPAPAAPAKPVAAAAPAAPAPKPAAAAAAPAAPAPPKPAAPPPKPAAPAVPVEDPREVERRMMASLAEERRAKALAEAKARLAKEAEAVAAAKALAAKAAQQKAPSPTPEPEPPKPKAAAAPKAASKPAPAAPKQAPAAAPKQAAAAPAASDADVAAEKKKVQAWIAAWQAKQSGAPAPAPAAASSNGVAPAAAKTTGYDDASAAKAKQEAKAWIAKWQAKQASQIKQ